DALQNGYRSMAAFPLRCEGKIVGVFCLYATEIAFFDEDETKVLDEMAMDISFALEVNRHEDERRKGEQELRRRTAFLEALVESALDGVLVIDSQGKKILQNQRLIDVLRVPPAIAADPDFSPQLEHVKSVMKDPEKFAEKAHFLINHLDEISRDEVELADGTILDRYSAPVKDKDLNYYGRIWTLRDITERRQLEAQFRQAQKMEAIGQLTGGIAHDFNNLLTVMLGCSEFIAEDVKDNARLVKMAQMVIGAAKRGAELTHRMLAFARRQTLQPRPVDINQLLAGMENFLRRTLSADIELHLIQSHTECEATIDPAQLENALLNLCVNARDAMPNGGKLTIEASSTALDADYAGQNADVTAGEYVLLAVSDTGCGISQQNLGRVFDPFFTTKEVGKGTGLGLSMVYGFVKQSQGHVKIYSEVGRGTSVKLYLPKSSVKGEPAIPDPISIADLRGYETILLVEDNDPVREFAKLQLTSLGYLVLEAANGSTALAMLKEHREVNLLFTDIVMPGGLNGRELARKACRINPTLKVLYCSGYAENATVHQGLLEKDMQLLNKPYTRLDLAKKIRGVLAER
ncbi:MAG: ATP-binding protein, partial [Terracidiphilus sp.]